MENQKLLLIDDETDFRDSLSESLPEFVSKNHEIVPLDQETFRNEISLLEERRKNARSPNDKTESPSIFDSAAFAFIDFDLLEYDDNVFFTGEDVAYLARGYSDVGAIVMLNSGPSSPTFDLTLRPSLTSFSDLSVSAEDVRNPRLWSQSDGRSYRPWSWPLLTRRGILARRRAAELETKLSDPLLDVLELRDIISEFDRAYIDLLGSDYESASIRDFVRKSPMGLKTRDSYTRDDAPTTISDSRIALVAQSRITRWLEFVLAGQHILVDAPHLYARAPGAFNGVSLEDFPEQLCGLHDEARPTNTYTYSPHIEGARYEHQDWLGRDVWNWAKLKNVDLEEIMGDLIDTPDFGFCEDLSGFRPIDQCHRFRADIPTSYPLRYVATNLVAPTDGGNIEVEYKPKVRLLT